MVQFLLNQRCLDEETEPKDRVSSKLSERKPDSVNSFFSSCNSFCRGGTINIQNLCPIENL